MNSYRLVISHYFKYIIKEGKHLMSIVFAVFVKCLLGFLVRFPVKESMSSTPYLYIFCLSQSTLCVLL